MRLPVRILVINHEIHRWIAQTLVQVFEFRQARGDVAPCDPLIISMSIVTATVVVGSREEEAVKVGKLHVW